MTNNEQSNRVTAENEYEVMARELMKIMLYDNGAVNRFEPETERKYRPSHVKAITLACEQFFGKHPEFVTDEDFDNIAAGGLEENLELYGIYPEYEQLDKALNKYFDVM